MFICDYMNEHLLDYLYGLLDESEAATVRAHLASCPSCQATLREAEGHKSLLAKAARVIRNVPAFALPGETLEPAAERTTPLPQECTPQAKPAAFATSAPRVHRKSHIRRFWPTWAVAAALLVGAYFASADYQAGRMELVSEVASARNLVVDAEAKFDSLRRAVEQERSDIIPLQAKATDSYFLACGNMNYNPEVTNTYTISARDVLGNPQKVPVHVEVLDTASGKILFEDNLACKGDASVTVPAGLPVDKRATLVIQAGNSEIRETLLQAQPTHATHLALNKSVYQVGEVIFFRTLTLDRFSLKPSPQSIPLRFSLVNAEGQAVKQFGGQTGPGGITGGQLALTNELPAGAYSLQVTADPGSDAIVLPQARALELVRTEMPQFAFDRDQYKPGDTINGMFRAGTAKGSIPGKQQVTGTLKYGGKPVPQPSAPTSGRVNVMTDEKGNATMPFTLPPHIEAQKTAEIELEYQQGKEKVNLVQPIPVVPSGMAIDFFPEGGDLVAGLMCKVYYRVKTPLGDAVDPEGHVIVLEGAKEIFRSERKKGLGSFTLTPEPRATYTVRITGSGKTTEIPNPFARLKIKSGGIVLHAPESVVNGTGPIPMVLSSQGAARRILVLTTCRGQIVHQQFINLAEGPCYKSIPIGGPAQGVLRVTAYDTAGDQLVPMAERLVYRAPAQRLNVALSGTALSKKLHPAQTASLGFNCTDELKKPAPAWALMAVVDERFRAEKAERGLNAHFYLAGDFGNPDDLDNAHIMVNDAPASAQALDLFLGTQGWRRFVRADALQVLANSDDLASSKGESKGKGDNKTRSRQTVVLPVFFNRENESPQKLHTQYETNVERAVTELIDKARREREILAQQKSAGLKALESARDALARYDERPLGYLRIAMGFLVIAFLVAGGLLVVTGIYRMARRGERGPSGAFAAAFACLFACLALYFIGSRLPAPAVEPRRDAPARQTDGEFVQAWPDLKIDAKELVETAQLKAPSRESKSTLSGNYVAMLAPKLAAEMDETKKDSAWKSAVAAQVADLSRKSPLRTYNQGGYAGGFGGLDPSTSDGSRYPPVDAQILQIYEQAARLQSNHQELAKIGPEPKETSVPAPVVPVTPTTKLSESQTYWSYQNFDSFVHQNRKQKQRDFQDTLVWYPVLFADEGQAQVTFGLSDNVTTYRVLIYANSPTGRLGFLESHLNVRAK